MCSFVLKDVRGVCKIGFKVLVAVGTISLIWNLSIIFISITIGSRRENRIYSIPALF